MPTITWTTFAVVRLGTPVNSVKKISLVRRILVKTTVSVKTPTIFWILLVSVLEVLRVNGVESVLLWRQRQRWRPRRQLKLKDLATAVHVSTEVFASTITHTPSMCVRVA